jgi:hypothetical protein
MATTISPTPVVTSSPNEPAQNIKSISQVEEIDSSSFEQKPLLFFIDDDVEKISEKTNLPNNRENGLTKNAEGENIFSSEQTFTNGLVDEIPKTKLTNGELSKSTESKSEPRFDSLHQVKIWVLTLKLENRSILTQYCAFLQQTK